MTRREQLYPEIKRLREVEGLKWREIGERFGLSLKTVHDYYHAPTKQADVARRSRYFGVCQECGGHTNNGGQAEGPPAVCNDCARPPWTREAVIEAMRGWSKANGGKTPRCVDAHIGESGHGVLPYERSVKALFGTWNDAVVAAGLAMNKDRTAETYEAMRDAVLAGERVASIAARYGVTTEAVYQRLRNHGTPVGELRRVA